VRLFYEAVSVPLLTNVSIEYTALATKDCAGAQFACSVSTKVQTLTREALRASYIMQHALRH
jgi:hypothetical protein